MNDRDRAWELHIIDYIENHKRPGAKVIDINTSQPADNLFDWYKQDIDILVIFNFENDFDICSYEVKSDNKMHRTNNIFVEFSLNHPNPDESPKNKAVMQQFPDLQVYYPLEPYEEPGWLYYSKADYLLYTDTVNETMYKIPLPALKTHIEENPGKFNVGVAYDQRKYEVVESKGYCINIDYILENIDGCIVYKNIGKPRLGSY